MPRSVGISSNVNSNLYQHVHALQQLQSLHPRTPQCKSRQCKHNQLQVRPRLQLHAVWNHQCWQFANEVHRFMNFQILTWTFVNLTFFNELLWTFMNFLWTLNFYHRGSLQTAIYTQFTCPHITANYMRVTTACTTCLVPSVVWSREITSHVIGTLSNFALFRKIDFKG